ncbi:hypothetical protein ACFWY9_34930 [Amycolatopsis sp. NPDC059027]|uniref:hypothetical protein n=1 Tax=unclassified Amycolatopsis TaxID=2618356 RepID=UPI00366D2AEB
MRKTAVFGAVAVLGASLLAVPAAAQPTPVSPAAPAPAGVSVQLNADTAAKHGSVNKFVRDSQNVALAQCPTPKTATFSSPVLAFGRYDFGSVMGVQANVSAVAWLNSGTAAGDYPLTVTCEGKSYTATFSVSAPQVEKVPSGAAKAGDGSLAE